MSPGRELKALGVMNSSRLCKTWATLGHELVTLDAINNVGLWLT